MNNRNRLSTFSENNSEKIPGKSVEETAGQWLENSRLRLKESDRIAAMQTELAKLGLGVACQGDTLSIQGIGEGYCHTPDRPLWGWNDHRVVMSLAVAATRADGPVAIEGAEAVGKSYPHFFADLQRAGIRVELI